VLAPEITIFNASESIKKAWVLLITEKTYEQAKEQIKASGSADLLGLIGANGEYTYNQFNEKRRDYVNLNQGTLQEEPAISIFRQSLPPKAGEYFVECIRIAATGGTCVRRKFSHAWRERRVTEVQCI
jgi:hypothetical protein